jgi:hypothetical protein
MSVIDKIIKYNKDKKLLLPNINKIEYKENHVELYENKKSLGNYQYQVIGLYNQTKSVWTWGWFIDFANRKTVDKVLLVKDWSNKQLENKKLKTEKEQSLYFYTKNGNFMTNQKNVDFFIKIAMYVLKGKYYNIIKHSEKNTDVIFEYIIFF